MWYIATLFNVVKASGSDIDDLKFNCPDSLKRHVRIYKGYGPRPLTGARNVLSSYRLVDKDAALSRRERRFESG